ncbi:MAG: hypothetical protein ACXVSX_21650 [Solirubrobacteraceae bacterium]
MLDQLDPVGEQASEIEAAAREQARHRHDDAMREAAAILAEAQVRGDGERARAAAGQRAAAASRMDAARAASEHEVERIRMVRDERVERLVDEVVECVRRSDR